MNTIQEIAGALYSSDRVLLFPHKNMDGDALGSCAALAHCLRSLGKEARIVISEDIPENLAFLDLGLCTENPRWENREYTSVLVDCGELKRIKGREDFFLAGNKTICIDHHQTTEAFCQYNYVDPEAAATGEIVYSILLELGITSDLEEKDILRHIANSLFAAITTDTGNFQYSNAGKLSHEIMVELYDWGLEHNKVSIEIYENNRLERLKLEAAIMSNTQLFCGGKAALTFVTGEMLKKTGAFMNETESIVDMLRSIRGVEVAIFLKEEEEKLIRCSLRSKEWFDVAELAGSFDGGGHVRASGFTLYTDLEDSIARVKEAVEERLQG